MYLYDGGGKGTAALLYGLGGGYGDTAGGEGEEDKGIGIGI